MGIKPGPKRIAISTGKPDRRQHDNKKTPGNSLSLKPHHHKKVISISSKPSDLDVAEVDGLFLLSVCSSFVEKC
jgi:hypothetical protein